jgi:hypothetical protein
VIARRAKSCSCEFLLCVEMNRMKYLPEGATEHRIYFH